MKTDYKKIRRERVTRGWSQIDLARLIKSHSSLISKIEGGHTNGSPRTIRAIADALGIPMEEFIVSES